jgi:hypothetical protein
MASTRSKLDEIVGEKPGRDWFVYGERNPDAIGLSMNLTAGWNPRN